jgi:hypothetical protein
MARNSAAAFLSAVTTRVRSWRRRRLIRSCTHVSLSRKTTSQSVIAMADSKKRGCRVSDARGALIAVKVVRGRNARACAQPPGVSISSSMASPREFEPVPRCGAAPSAGSGNTSVRRAPRWRNDKARRRPSVLNRSRSICALMGRDLEV